MKKGQLIPLLIFLGLVLAAVESRASETGHYSPGVMNIRDYIVPDPGFYGVLYNYFYTTNRLNDSNGDKVSSIQIGPKGGVKVNVDVNMDMYAVAPAFIWVSDWKILGAKYAVYLAPTFANSNVSTALSTETGLGINPTTSEFNVGDLFAMPIWLGWAMTHWDAALGYGFYAPVGKYATETITFPRVGPRTVTSADNIGLGFWTHQFQGSLAWYPWADKRMAVATALTYEINQNKKDFDLTPGQHLTLNWGISQYLPLTDDEKLLLEVGPAGYSSWQITDDSGREAQNPSVHDQVHGAGGQLGLTYVPWSSSLNLLYYYEFYSEDRFQGQSLGLNFAMKF